MSDHVDSGVRRILNLPQVYTFYQNLVYPLNQKVRYFSQYIRPENGFKILDIGCGPGSAIEILNKLVSNYQYIGFDFNEKYIQIANERYGKYGDFVCSRVEDYHSDMSNSFDIVIANAILHHINDDEALTLFKTAKSVLKQGGRLITFDPVWIKDQNFISKTLIKFDRGQNVRTKEALSDLSGQVFENNTFYIDSDFLRIPYDIIIGEYIK